MLQRRNVKYLAIPLALLILSGCGGGSSNSSESNKSLTFSEKFDVLPTNIDSLSASYDYDYDKNTDYSSNNSMSYKGGDEYADNFIDEMTQKLRKFKDNLSNTASKSDTSNNDEELKKYYLTLKKEFNTSSEGLQRRSTSLDGYISGYVNQQEYNLYLSDPVKALLCMGNGKLAISYSESNYRSSALHNGNGDAFRHALWNYGMSQDVGRSFAKKWADAHENGTTNNPWHEKIMDLYNNRAGRNLSETRAWSISQMITRTKQAVKTGKMVTTDLTYFYYSNRNGEK